MSRIDTLSFYPPFKGAFWSHVLTQSVLMRVNAP